MRLLFLALHPDLPSSRLRVVELVPHLEALGASCDVRPYPDRRADRRALGGELAGYDAVVVQKRLPSRLEARAWRRAPVPVVFDFDDALPYRQRPRRGGYESLQRRRRFERAKAAADAFACGSPTLLELVSDAGKPAAVVPTAVPVEVPVRGEAPPDRPVRVGWIGGRGNLGELDALAPVFAELARSRALELVVISDAPWGAGGVRTRHVPWSLAGQAAALAELDVGIMPLADTPWNRGKCAYKLLQYMAAGVCAVGSPVGMNAGLIRDGENGLLAADEAGWLDRLDRATRDAALRARLGAAGRATVEQGYSREAVARLWLALLARIGAGSAPASE